MSGDLISRSTLRRKQTFLVTSLQVDLRVTEALAAIRGAAWLGSVFILLVLYSMDC